MDKIKKAALLSQVTERLSMLGYEAISADQQALSFLFDKAEAYVLSFCNIQTIPDKLIPAFVDCICGDFLQEKKATGALSDQVLEQVVQSIKMGDSQVSYAAGVTPDQRFDALIRALSADFEKQLVQHRRLSW